MVITKDGTRIPDLKRRYGTKKDYINLYIIIKEKSVTNSIVKEGINDIGLFFKKYIHNQKIWSKEVVQGYLNTPTSALWRKAIIETYPDLNSLNSILANVSGIALLDFLIDDSSSWSLDNLNFEDISDNIQFKLYEKV